ncbi:PP2C family protein-serine/threonine phosphatase [Patescibacteria group bacterium]
MYSIKTKLIAVITLLIIGLFGAAAFLLIREQQKELTSYIFFQTRSFGELTSNNIINDYNLYLAQKGFIYFNREMAANFSRTQDIDLIQVFDYNAELLYDSEEEKEKQYDGPARVINDSALLKQIKAHNPSVLTLDGRLVFLKKVEASEVENQIQYVDENEKPVEPIGELERIQYLVFPTQDQFAVTYHVNYANLDELIKQGAIRILILSLLGVVIGLFLIIIVSNRITKPIKTLTQGAGIIGQGDFQHRIKISTHDELEILGNAFNQMAVDLDKSTKALVYKERVAKELEVAQKIQEQNIPKKLPLMEGLDISAGIVPAEEIGGDVYDFLKRDEENTMFYVGDVTGHGVPSGILGSIANAMFFSNTANPNLKDVVIDVNKVLKVKSPANMFITLCLLNWNKTAKQLNYVNAGHEQMLHFNVKTKDVQLLKGGGIALGMFPDITKMIEEQIAPLEVGDTLVLYSDGIPEAWKSQKENYGMDRFKASLQQFGDLATASEIRNSILKNVKEFIGDYKQMDDITIIVIKRTS